MRPFTLTCHLITAIILVGIGLVNAQSGPVPIAPVSATASSSRDSYPAAKAIDGKISDASRWVSEASASPAWLEIDLGASRKLAGIHLYSGYGDRDPIQDFAVQFWTEGQWRDIPSAQIKNNRSVALAIPFDDTLAVTADRIRLWITASHQDTARVKEVVIWPAGQGDLPPILQANNPSGEVMPPLIYLNQSGFDSGKPKRFTAPTLPDGTSFSIQVAGGGPDLFAGVIIKHIGDFSPFEPNDNREYAVVAAGIRSVPFRIGNWWLERVTYQNAVNFMIDSRHYVGNERATCAGSFGWRDDHHFGWELHTLIPQYLSNPSAYDRMPRQVRYEQPDNRKLWGALEPYKDDAPDIVKLIHWGADVIVTQGVTHEMLKAQLAYFLYAWPALEPYLSQQNYRVVHDFVFAHWADSACDRKYPYDESPEHNLLVLKTKVGSTKGAYPPGFSIQPNLLLYEVARSENRSDAGKYFQAAYNQAEWIIANLDWNDPQTTKGQRMSEFITMTGLVYFLRQYPERAPAGLTDKIEQWARVVLRRSDNMWDFRKLDDGDKWTPMGDQPTMWNEPGNVVGLPAALLAAQLVVKDPAILARLKILVWSHFDNAFGRNPVGRHFSYDAPREIEGVEHGWFRFYPGGIGRLAAARFVLDGSPKDTHYPYHPEKGDIGWTEGWVQFNTPFNLSLAYLALADTHITLSQNDDLLTVSLQSPLNFDYDRVEYGTVLLTSGSGDREYLKVMEDTPNAKIFTGYQTFQLSNSPVQLDGVLQAKLGDQIEVSYGYGCWGHRADIILR